MKYFEVLGSPSQLALVDALERVGGVNAMAGKVGVSRQVVHKWRDEGDVPIIRAHQIELLTGVPWYSLCPGAMEKINTVKEFVAA